MSFVGRPSSATACVFVLLGVAFGVTSCRRDDVPPAAAPSGAVSGQGYPQQGYPQQGYPQQGYPQQGYPQQGYPPPNSTPPSPAVLSPRGPSFPCASEADFVCAFAHCVQGGCGGCTSDADCKPNGACTQTPLGYACLARGFASTPAPPTPAPTFAPTVPTFTPPQTPMPTPPATPPATTDRFARARQLCVDRTNEYRARVGARPVARRHEREGCIDGEAAADSSSGKAHGTMGRCGESAQNACPDYPGQSPESTLSDCLAQMFAEGPGEPYSAHGHYLNMTEPSYTGVACGFFVTPSGKLWINQDFYR